MEFSRKNIYKLIILTLSSLLTLVTFSIVFSDLNKREEWVVFKDDGSNFTRILFYGNMDCTNATRKTDTKKIVDDTSAIVVFSLMVSGVAIVVMAGIIVKLYDIKGKISDNEESQTVYMFFKLAKFTFLTSLGFWATSFQVGECGSIVQDDRQIYSSGIGAMLCLVTLFLLPIIPISSFAASLSFLMLFITFVVRCALISFKHGISFLDNAPSEILLGSHNILNMVLSVVDFFVDKVQS